MEHAGLVGLKYARTSQRRFHLARGSMCLYTQRVRVARISSWPVCAAPETGSGVQIAVEPPEATLFRGISGTPLPCCDPSPAALGRRPAPARHTRIDGHYDVEPSHEVTRRKRDERT